MEKNFKGKTDMEEVAKIHSHIKTYDEKVYLLQQIINCNLKTFKKAPQIIESARELLESTIEIMIEVATLLIAKFQLQAPTSNVEVFQILNFNNFLIDERSKNYIEIVNFRNKILYFFDNTPPQELYNFLKKHIKNFKLFKIDVLKIIHAEIHEANTKVG